MPNEIISPRLTCYLHAFVDMMLWVCIEFVNINYSILQFSLSMKPDVGFGGVTLCYSGHYSPSSI